MFVHLARAIAANGGIAMRFDVRGMGDSTGAQRGFEQLTPDIGAALDCLCEHVRAASPVLLCGLCDGASAALLYQHDRRDKRVVGMSLLNPWVRSEETLARTHVRHYYLRRLTSVEFWSKLLRGGIGGAALGGFVGTLSRALRGAASTAAEGREGRSFRDAMLHGWARCGGPIQLVLSGDDLTAQEFADATHASEEWRRLLALPGVTRVDLAGADHTLSSSPAAREFTEAFMRWLGSFGPVEHLTAESRSPIAIEIPP